MTDTVTRIAPSPTGDPHVGTAYVALFNYAFARNRGGRFILRIEDTDRQRSSPASEKMIFEALRWLGLEWDEGPDVGGPHGPYRQSERSSIYREHAEELIGRGAAYPCFCSKERLDALRAEQRDQQLPFGYDGRCRSLSRADATARRRAGEPAVVRLWMPERGETVVHDLLRGEVRFGATELEDPVVLKSDGYPTYHLANVVDDHLMGITHVIRAEEWISSLPKHDRLYRAFGWRAPVFCHLPLLRNADRSKISKRKNPVSLNYYRRAGFLPEAMLNFLALMGWAMPAEPGDEEGREEFSLEEFIAALTLERIRPGGPVFDLQKLRWLNGRYLRRLAPDELLARLRQELLSDRYLLEIIPLVQERIDRLDEFIDYGRFFLVGEIEYDEAARKKLVAPRRTPQETAKMLRVLLEERLDPLLEWKASSLEEVVRGFSEEGVWATRDLFMTLRVAVTGRAATPPLFDTMAVLGKEICRARIRQAIGVLRSIKG